MRSNGTGGLDLSTMNWHTSILYSFVVSSVTLPIQNDNADRFVDYFSQSVHFNCVLYLQDDWPLQFYYYRAVSFIFFARSSAFKGDYREE